LTLAKRLVLHSHNSELEYLLLLILDVGLLFTLEQSEYINRLLDSLDLLSIESLKLEFSSNHDYEVKYHTSTSSFYNY